MCEYFESKWACDPQLPLDREEAKIQNRLFPEETEQHFVSPMASSPNPDSVGSMQPLVSDAFYRDAACDEAARRALEESETTQPASDSQEDNSKLEDSQVKLENIRVEEEDNDDDMPTSPAKELSSTFESMIGV